MQAIGTDWIARDLAPRRVSEAFARALAGSVLGGADAALVNPSDAAIPRRVDRGAVAALVAIAGRWQRTALAVCLVLWLSICVAGQDFLSFQWDILLLEAGFLAIFAGQFARSASGFSAGCSSA